MHLAFLKTRQIRRVLRGKERAGTAWSSRARTRRICGEIRVRPLLDGEKFPSSLRLMQGNNCLRLQISLPVDFCYLVDGENLVGGITILVEGNMPGHPIVRCLLQRI